MKTTERHKNRQKTESLRKQQKDIKKRRKKVQEVKKNCQRLMYRILHIHFWFVLGKTVKQDL